MRSDSILITGATSETRLERIKRLEAEKRRVKESKKSALTPVEEVIFTEIDKIKTETQTEILGLVGISTDKELLKETFVSLKLYGESMDRLKSRMRNILRRRDEDNS